LRERTHRRNKTSKRVKLAERSGFVARIQGDREARPSGRVKRELIVVGGIRQPRESVGVEETGGNKVREASGRHAGG